MKTHTPNPVCTCALAFFLTISVSLHAQEAQVEDAPSEAQAYGESAAVPTIDPIYMQGVQEWNEMNALQGAACAPEHDAKEVLLGKKKVATVILLHGYSQSPKAMDEYLQFFSAMDVNILVPRLSHHFNTDISDLDKVNYMNWVQQMRQTVSIAKKLGRRIIVVGYSLGGSLATRMALEFPKDITGLILLSPAWRINPRISGGLLLGNLTEDNGHDYLGYKPACDLKKAYLSKNGGAQVEKLAANNEENKEDQFRGSYPSGDDSVIRKLELPMLTAIMADDDVIDSRLAREMFTPMEDGYRTLLVFSGTDHSLLTTPSAAACQSFSPVLSNTPFAGRNLTSQLNEFSREVLGIRTDIMRLGKDIKIK